MKSEICQIKQVLNLHTFAKYVWLIKHTFLFWRRNAASANKGLSSPFKEIDRPMRF